MTQGAAFGKMWLIKRLRFVASLIPLNWGKTLIEKDFGIPG
jgi:hypothetical protein